MKTNGCVTAGKGRGLWRVCCLLMLLFIGAQSPMAPKANEGVRVVDVYDGDTFFVDLACTNQILCKHLGIRIRGIDTPEIRGRCADEKQQALRARDTLRALLQKGEVLLHRCKRGKYFRLICDVEVNQQDIASQLLAKGLARPYDGRKKRSNWCKEETNR